MTAQTKGFDGYNKLRSGNDLDIKSGILVEYNRHSSSSVNRVFLI